VVAGRRSVVGELGLDDTIRFVPGALPLTDVLSAPTAILPPRASPRRRREDLRGPIEIPHPAMQAKDFELLNRQRAQLSRTNVGVDVAQRTHAGDDRRDGGVRKAIPQSYFGEAFDRDTEVFSDGLDAFPDLPFSVAAKVAVAPVTFGELGLRFDVAGQ